MRGPPVLPCHLLETCHMDTPLLTTWFRWTPRLLWILFMDRTTHLLDQDPRTPCHVSDTSHMSQPMKISQTTIWSHFPRQPTATRRLLSPQGQDSSRGAMVYRLYPAQCVLRTTLRLRRTTRILWMTWSTTWRHRKVTGSPQTSTVGWEQASPSQDTPSRLGLTETCLVQAVQTDWLVIVAALTEVL